MTTPSSRNRFRGLYPYFWIIPTIMLLGVFLLIPLFANIYASTNVISLKGGELETKYVGIDIYRRLFDDPRVILSIKNTFLFTFGTVAFEAVFGTMIAVALASQRKAKGFFITVILLPMMLTPVVVALMWKLLWDSQYGFINYFISIFGFASQVWLANPKTALPAIIVTSIWQNTSFVVLIVYGALQSVSEELIEAAAVDGANSSMTFWYIVFPLVLPSIIVAILFRTLFAFRTFDTVFVLTSGGPADKTLIMGLYAYRLAFRYVDFSGAAGLAWIMFLICLILVLVYILTIRKLPSNQ